ncbi:hypothetical protein M9H77_03561 [Catharanthus roseus]|uniref:Uncharacterized protein n=1 Tax=Catharanthus roseus TaxID=4058 RepID=A0ACC0CC44_CATRO|nr:hypothetical protein M9H77_03561 [Catharanthus roseus]
MDNEFLRGTPDGSSSSPSTKPYSAAFTYETKNTHNHSDQNRKDGEIKKVHKISGGGLVNTVLEHVALTEGRMIYTPYNARGYLILDSWPQVADEIVAEFSASQSNSLTSLNEKDAKNLCRQVYDSLMFKKEIQWKGLPNSDAQDSEEIKVVHSKLIISSIRKKAPYLKDLENQVTLFLLQSLLERSRHV